MDDAELELEEAADRDPATVKLERAQRALLVAIYAVDLVFCVDLLTDGSVRRWLSARADAWNAARRRRREWARSRARMLFEAAYIVEEGAP